MTQYLVPLAIFAIALIELLVRRIRRDAGGRVDSHYFTLSAHVTAMRLGLLVVATLGDINPRSEVMMVVGSSFGLASAYFMALFAYSFPLNRRPPRSLRWGLLAISLACVALVAPFMTRPTVGPILALTVAIPYFALTVFFIQRNWRASIVPGTQKPAASVTIVQAAVLAPWLMIMTMMVLMRHQLHAGMPSWVFLAQALVVSVVAVGGIGIAVLRYHLFEVRILMTEVVISVLAAGSVASYLGLGAAPLYAWLAHRTTAALAAAVVAMVPPFIVRWLVQSLDEMVNRVACTINPKGPDRNTVERVLTASARLVDPHAVLVIVSTKIAEVTHGEVQFLRAEDIPIEHPTDADRALIELVTEQPRSFYCDEQRPELDPALVARMDALHAQLLLPVRRADKLYGLLVVRGVARVQREMALISAALADHLALKLENFSLYASAALAERKLADARAQTDTLSRELEESRRLAALGSFAAAIAHDIRTPLTSISMNVQILREHAWIDAHDREYLDIALEEIERLNRSVGEILDFAKPLALQPTTATPAELTDDVARTLEPLWAERGITLQIVRDDTPGDVTVDERRMRQVLLNLLENAAEASTRGSSVTLHTTSTERSVVFEVRDQGRGIEEAHIERIFEPFFTTRTDGTGLGLAIAQKIVRAHGGELRVRSTAGEGTVFTVELPRVFAAERAPERLSA